LDLERLEVQISTLTSEKSSLENRVTHLESGKIEAEKLLRITEEMLEAVKEESESLKAQMDSHSAVIGDKESQADKALLEKLAELEDDNDQCAEIISQLEKDLKRAWREKDLQLEKVKALEDETSRLRKEVENRETLMMKIQEESGIAEAELNDTLEELTKLQLKEEADQEELKRLRSDIKGFLRAENCSSCGRCKKSKDISR
jgi:chromosome segregation ATPase